jgi:hypothetical protein
VSVVVTLSACETFTPCQLTTAYKDFTKRGPQYLDAETGLKLAAYRFGGRGLIVCEELTGLVVLYSPECVVGVFSEVCIRSATFTKP